LVLLVEGSHVYMFMWSPSQTGGFPPGIPISSHTKTTERKHRYQRA